MLSKNVAARVFYGCHCPSSGHFRDSWQANPGVERMQRNRGQSGMARQVRRQLRPTVSARLSQKCPKCQAKKRLSSLRALVLVVPEIGVEPTTFALRMGRTAYRATVRHTPQQLNQQVSTLTVCWCVLDCCGVFIPTVPKLSKKTPPGSRASHGRWMPHPTMTRPQKFTKFLKIPT